MFPTANVQDHTLGAANIPTFKSMRSRDGSPHPTCGRPIRRERFDDVPQRQCGEHSTVSLILHV